MEATSSTERQEIAPSTAEAENNRSHSKISARVSEEWGLTSEERGVRREGGVKWEDSCGRSEETELRREKRGVNCTES